MKCITKTKQKKKMKIQSHTKLGGPVIYIYIFRNNSEQ